MRLPADARRRLALALARTWARRGLESALLLPLAWLFESGVRLRRALFASGAFATHRLPVPVVVVGNLIVGGAGKTPAVLAVVTLLRSQGYTPGIVSRGYGRHDGEAVLVVGIDATAARVGDEPLLLERRSGAPVAVGRDRVAAAHALLRARPEVDVVISDDGLQHLALQRDVEIIVFDERGAGNGRMLPAGPLRERIPAGLGHGCIVLYNAPRPTTSLPGFVSRRALAGVVPLARWWRGDRPEGDSFAPIRGRRVLAVAGVAQPEPFFAMLRNNGMDIDVHALDDHHDFATLPWPATTSDVVLTEKDAVKLAPSRPISTRVWVAALDFEPEPAFDAALLAILRQHGATALPVSPAS